MRWQTDRSYWDPPCRLPPPPPCTWSRWGVRATRSTPRSWRPGWRRRVRSGRPTPRTADAVMVNTCGFVEAAKKDSVDTLLAAADLKDDRPGPGGGRRRLPGRALRRPSWPRRCRRPTPCSASTTTPTWPAGCGPSWPESGQQAHRPRDRRRLLPIAPGRPTGGGRRDVAVPGHAPASGPRTAAPPPGGRADGTGQDRLRLRPALHVLRHSDASAAPTSPARWPTSWPRPAGWSAEGVRELFLVSENTTSYGKDLGDLRLLEQLLTELSGGRRAGLDPGLLPAAGRDAAQPGGGDDRDRQGGAVLRPVLPARRAGRAAADAPVR